MEYSKFISLSSGKGDAIFILFHFTGTFRSITFHINAITAQLSTHDSYIYDVKSMWEVPIESVGTHIRVDCSKRNKSNRRLVESINKWSLLPKLFYRFHTCLPCILCIMHAQAHKHQIIS